MPKWEILCWESPLLSWRHEEPELIQRKDLHVFMSCYGTNNDLSRLFVKAPGLESGQIRLRSESSQQQVRIRSESGKN